MAGASAGLYIVSILALGGFQQGDLSETLYPAILMAHGDWSCAYPSVSLYPVPMAAPGYSLLDAAVQWILRIGYATPFPALSQFGHACRLGADVFGDWTAASNEIPTIIHTSLFAWFALAAAATYVARQTAIGRTRQIWLIPLTLAITPPVLFAVQEYFHPQDQLALAFFLAASGLFLRRNLGLAGVVAAAAYVTQQYTVIGLIILVVLTTGTDRWRLVRGFTLALASFTAFAYWALGEASLKAALLGTGESRIQPGTWMAELHVPKLVGIGIARLLPLLVAGLIAAWCVRRRRDFARDPELLLGLLAVGWSLRVLFEINLFGYYLLATAATLVLRDIVAKRAFRGTIWLLLATVVSFGHFSVWRDSLHNPPDWPYQLIFAPATVAVAFASLRSSLRSRTLAEATLEPNPGPRQA